VAEHGERRRLPVGTHAGHAVLDDDHVIVARVGVAYGSVDAGVWVVPETTTSRVPSA
jgi:hypothetical protein